MHHEVTQKPPGKPSPRWHSPAAVNLQLNAPYSPYPQALATNQSDLLCPLWHGASGEIAAGPDHPGWVMTGTTTVRSVPRRTTRTSGWRWVLPCWQGGRVVPANRPGQRGVVFDEQSTGQILRS
jgi:hypothetical protein